MSRHTATYHVGTTRGFIARALPLVSALGIGLMAYGSTAARLVTRASPLVEPSAAGPTLVTQLGGRIEELASVEDSYGHRLFVAVGSRIEVYSVEDPDRPTRLGTTPALPAQAMGLQVVGRYLYVPVLHGGLYVLDAGSEIIPHVVGSIPGVSGSVSGIEVHKGFAYLADRTRGLVIIDVRDPTTPKLVDVLEYTVLSDASSPLRLEAMDRKDYEVALVTRGGDAYMSIELIIVDISEPTDVVELGRVGFVGSNPRSVLWYEDYAYIGSTSRGLQVVDATDSTDPIAMGEVALPSGFRAGRVHRRGETLYMPATLGLGGSESALITFDLRDPSSPRLGDMYRNGPWIVLSIEGDRFYSRTSQRIAIYEQRDDGEPTRHGAIEFLGGAYDADADQDLLWFMGAQGLVSVSTSEPASAATRFATEWESYRIAVNNGRLYSASAEDGLRTVDVSNPSDLRELPPILPESPAVELRNIAVDRDRGYGLAWRGAGGRPTDLWILDLAESEGPALVGSLPLNMGWNGMAQLLPVGDILIISSDSAASAREIIVVDVHDAGAPREVHRFSVDQRVRSFALSDRGDVFASSEGAITRYEIEIDPIELVERDRWATGRSGAERVVYGISVTGDRLYAVLSAWSTDVPTRDVDAFGHAAALAEFAIASDGSLTMLGEAPLPATLNLNASYRPIVRDDHVWVVSASKGLNVFSRRASEARDTVIHLPLLKRDGG